MDINSIMELMRGGVGMVLRLCAPILGAALAIGLVIAIFQAVTSIQEQTLTFLPKMVVILLALALLSGVMFSEMREYTMALFLHIPDLAR